jgi:hypothetical protein
MNVRLSIIVLAGLASGGGIATVAQEPITLTAPGHGESKSVSLGTVKIGAYEVEVFQEGAVTAGKEATFQLKLKGQGEPDAIRAWIGIESGRGSSKGKAHKHGDTIELHCDVPDPILESSKLWLELEVGGVKTKGSVDYKSH